MKNHPIFDIPCVIFAGGKSSRMGQDKSLLPFGGYDSLAEFQYNRLKPFFKEIYISTKDQKKFNFNPFFILDNSEIYAPTIAIQSIFNTIQSNCFLAIAVDTPFISIEEIEHLIIQHKNNASDITVASYENQLQPLFAIYTKNVLPQINTMVQNNVHKLNFLIKESNFHEVILNSGKIVINLNYFSEYQKALSL